MQGQNTIKIELLPRLRQPCFLTFLACGGRSKQRDLKLQKIIKEKNEKEEN